MWARPFLYYIKSGRVGASSLALPRPQPLPIRIRVRGRVGSRVGGVVILWPGYDSLPYQGMTNRALF